MSSVSGTLGFLSLPLLLVPGVGGAIAIAALATAAASATMKTSLYAVKARDASGQLYVSGGELTRSLGDVAINAAGIGTAAKVTQVAKAGKSFGRATAEQFSKTVLDDAWKSSKGVLALQRELGAKGAWKHLSHIRGSISQQLGAEGRKWVRSGVLINMAGPTLTTENSVGGVMSVGSLHKDFFHLFENDSDTPDLRLRVPPGTEPPPPAISQPKLPPQPVMDS